MQVHNASRFGNIPTTTPPSGAPASLHNHNANDTRFGVTDAFAEMVLRDGSKITEDAFKLLPFLQKVTLSPDWAHLPDIIKLSILSLPGTAAATGMNALRGIFNNVHSEQISNSVKALSNSVSQVIRKMSPEAEAELIQQAADNVVKVAAKEIA